MVVVQYDNLQDFSVWLAVSFFSPVGLDTSPKNRGFPS